jgi:hypothetical protein
MYLKTKAFYLPITRVTPRIRLRMIFSSRADLGRGRELKDAGLQRGDNPRVVPPVWRQDWST